MPPIRLAVSHIKARSRDCRPGKGLEVNIGCSIFPLSSLGPNRAHSMQLRGCRRKARPPHLAVATHKSPPDALVLNDVLKVPIFWALQRCTQPETSSTYKPLVLRAAFLNRYGRSTHCTSAARASRRCVLVEGVLARTPFVEAQYLLRPPENCSSAPPGATTRSLHPSSAWKHLNQTIRISSRLGPCWESRSLSSKRAAPIEPCLGFWIWAVVASAGASSALPCAALSPQQL